MRTLVGKGHAEARTTITMKTDIAASQLSVDISAADDGAARAWVLRVHLAPGQRVRAAVLDGAALADEALVHLAPTAKSEAGRFSPFGGKGARPAPLEGHIAELPITRGASPRTLRLQLE